MSACTFFGHRDCYGLDTAILQKAITELIAKGIDTFYVGHQGHFDSMVLGCLKALKTEYPHIQFSVVLAYIPTQMQEYDLYKDCSMYPDGLELSPLKFAIERRNKWMLERATHCLCYIQHTWGGAYKFARMAKRRRLQVVNLGTVEL